MNTNEQLNRALHSACMGNMSMAASWRNRALTAYESKQGELDFIAAHGQHGNTAKARAAHRLIAAEMAEAKANNKGHSPTWEPTQQDIEQKGASYKTARRKSDGAFVGLKKFYHSTRRFVIDDGATLAWYELDSFTL